ncbi:regulatory protein RecX [Gleimia hominis]|uniref:regulatory protein RecX n=1 Tax=Gleimia hominis TaxID=595468 RepID=UPI000C7F97E4|nr:regulatory protein RecX [Gleimia hominis]WIK64938.1 regulatory protein RecX [Gleimia hominis]
MNLSYDPDEHVVKKRRDWKKQQRRREERREWAASLEGEQAVEQAKEVALRMLDRQDRSVGQCRARLSERGFQPEPIEEALQRLVDANILDDERYARMLVRTRHAERGLVGRALVEQLRRKLIPPDVIEQALDEVDEDNTDRVASELVRKRLRTMGGVDRKRQRQRLLSMLARKGYPPSQSIRVISEVMEEDN